MRWLAVIVIVLACGKGEEPPGRSTGTVNAAPETGPKKGGGPSDRAYQVFASTCAQCHGDRGRGDGPVGETLNPKPRNYTDPKWQASVSDDEIRAIITKGGQAVGKSASMPPFGGRLDRQTIDGLVQIIRSFGKP
jgi:mono/diheme cytochrome c family protein